MEMAQFILLLAIDVNKPKSLTMEAAWTRGMVLQRKSTDTIAVATK